MSLRNRLIDNYTIHSGCRNQPERTQATKRQHGLRPTYMCVYRRIDKFYMYRSYVCRSVSKLVHVTSVFYVEFMERKYNVICICFDKEPGAHGLWRAAGSTVSKALLNTQTHRQIALEFWPAVLHVSSANSRKFVNSESHTVAGYKILWFPVKTNLKSNQIKKHICRAESVSTKVTDTLALYGVECSVCVREECWE